MRAVSTREKIMKEFEAVFNQRIEYCRRAFEIAGKPLQFQVMLNYAAHEAEKKLKVSEAIKPLAILQVQSNQAEIAFLKLLTEEEANNE